MFNMDIRKLIDKFMDGTPTISDRRQIYLQTWNLTARCLPISIAAWRTERC